MSPNPKRRVPNPGMWQEWLWRVKLVFRLLRDPRVPWYLKILPIGALVYLVAPDVLPFNPLDDTVIVGLGFYLFVELCPDEVVAEHMQALNRVVPGTWREVADDEQVEREAVKRPPRPLRK